MQKKSQSSLHKQGNHAQNLKNISESRQKVKSGRNFFEKQPEYSAPAGNIICLLINFLTRRIHLK